MEKTITSTGKQKRRLSKNVFKVGKSRSYSVFLLAGIGFFIGRLTIFQFMNPVAFAFCAGFLGAGTEFFIITALTAVGALTKYEGMYLLKYVLSFLILSGAELFYSISLISPGKKLKALTGAGAILLPGMLFAYLTRGGLYYNLMAGLETILGFSLFHVLQKGVFMIADTGTEVEKEGDVFNNEVLISFAILIGAIIAGAADIYIGPVSLKYLFCTTVILMMAYGGGSTLGATSGVLFGFILTLTGLSNYSLVGILSISGMIAGLLKDTGRIGSIIGFLAGGLITSFYLDMGILNIGLFYSVSLGACLFFFLPVTISLKIQTFFSSNSSDIEYTKRIKEITEDRLTGFAEGFKNLSKTFTGLSEKKAALDQRDVSKLIDDVASKVCTKCPQKAQCWEGDFYGTYQMSFALLEICEKKGSICISDISDHLYTVCEYIEYYADQINQAFELYKNNLLWHNRIVESRELVSQQLLGVSGIIMDLNKDLDFELNFNHSIEKRIINELTQKDITVKNCIVYENKEGKHEVTIQAAPCQGAKQCNKEIIPIVNTVLGKRMKKEEQSCFAPLTPLKQPYCKLKLVEESRFKIATGIARAVKDDSKKSGDSYSVLDIKGGNTMLILSDGMGSGQKASKESGAAIDLLENFIETGFDKETAIHMINSVLVLKSTEDSFSTLDMCSINLYTAVAEFVKIGAASTFIIRNNKVITVKSATLPMGILNSVEIETTAKRLKDGDIIVMVTDGMTEITDQEDKEAWIKTSLEEYTGVNPQDVAEYLLEKAKEITKNKVGDDMTVLAARIWERI